MMSRPDFAPSMSEIATVLRRKNYVLPGNDVDILLLGIRNSRNATNLFDDTFVLYLHTPKDITSAHFRCTTDPGFGPLANPNSKGTAILVPGQYVDGYKLGLHKGQYTALVQNRPLPVYRDGNRDRVLDYDVPVDAGFHGINIHRANSSMKSKQVDNWSAGCQVIADPGEFSMLISSVKEYFLHSKRNTVTYTLLERSDFL